MAGPGGGGSGGGFGGGSFGGGGSFSGGGFGTGMHHGTHFHGPRFSTGWGWGRRRYRTGGCGGFLLLILFLAFFAFYQVAPSESTVIGENEDGIFYDEAIMQDFADENYKLYFGNHENYENNILLVFLTNEECDGYYTIAWVGDNIRREINEMFGEYTEYGQALEKYINKEYYAYSLDTDLVSVIKEMTEKIDELGLVSSFDNKAANYDNYSKPFSKLVNSTSLEMNKELVDDALAAFTEKTGIPCVILLDSAESVFQTAPPAVTVTFEDDSSSDIAIIGGADGPTQIRTGSGVSYIFIILIVLLLLVIGGLILRLKKGNPVTEDTEERKVNHRDKNEKPPWEF